MEIKTGIYKHFKGGTSLVIGLSDSSDKNTRVLYIGMQDKKYHDRPLDEFFDQVEVKGEKVARFSLIQPIDITADYLMELFMNKDFQKNNNNLK